MMGQRIGQCQNSIEIISEQALVCSVSFLVDLRAIQPSVSYKVISGVIIRIFPNIQIMHECMFDLWLTNGLNDDKMDLKWSRNG